MKRLIVVCEGPTEQEFCKDVLYDYFWKKDISLEYPTIKHSNGGIVSWETLKKQILMHLHENGAVVSMFIDYYRIRDSYAFPDWMQAKKIEDIYDRMSFIFEGMRHDIPIGFRGRFIPYIQLHEFEGLLFSDITVFSKNFTSEELDINALIEAVNSASSPEEINNGPDTAPSERLKRAVSGYNKIVYGACLASEIGLVAIRAKCKGFNRWINDLEESVLS